MCTGKFSFLSSSKTDLIATTIGLFDHHVFSLFLFGSRPKPLAIIVTSTSIASCFASIPVQDVCGQCQALYRAVYGDKGTWRLSALNVMFPELVSPALPLLKNSSFLSLGDCSSLQPTHPHSLSAKFFVYLSITHNHPLFFQHR